ncbi:MAG: rhomboid family intramembrane serine protease [Calothrix sp. SM1_5_4]|nr:rhomboid family intramembrane serine protease [Calothrix sp. SM1_5_4]
MGFRRGFAVPIIIGINVFVFLRWNLADGGALEYMLENYTVIWDGLLAGRYWTLLTSVFSHNLLLHLLINMFVLNSFGTLLERVLGTRRFVFFYLLAGAFSSLSHGLVSAFILGRPDQPAVGASGAIAGLVLLFSLMFPREKILVFGLIPLPALFGALAFVGLDIWGLVAQAEGGGLPIGHGAHLGGALVGALYYFLFIRKTWRRKSGLGRSGGIL